MLRSFLLTPSDYHKLAVKLPALNEALFSLKCITAALLALYIAMYFGLPRPFWAMMTCYIVANPFSGPVRSKAVFRVIGTILGSIATILLIPQLANAPELLSLALAGWVGICLFISLLDRTPRSYVFMLAGYTAALIGFPAVSDPASIFDTALARVEEITIGIVCASFIHGLIFPQNWGPVMLTRLERVIRDTQHYLQDVFSNHDQSLHQKDRRMLAADVTELSVLATHLPFDTSHLRWTAGMIHAMRDRLSLVLPLLSGIEDRLQVLSTSGNQKITENWQTILQNIIVWSHTCTAADKHAAHAISREEIETQIRDLTPVIHQHSTWSDLIQINLATRLTELMQTFHDASSLHRRISESVNGQYPVNAHQTDSSPTRLHHDYRLATMSAFAAITAILACCFFWIISGWPSGSVAAMMAAVFCCFFAVQDDPVPSIKTFLKYTLLSIPVSAVYVLYILPAAHHFVTMIVVVAPLLFFLGLYLARPESGLKAIATILGILGSFALQENGGVDITVFLNTSIAQVVGVVVALITTNLLRSVSTSWRVTRLLDAGKEDLAQLCRLSSLPDMAVVSSRMMDRISQLVPRLAILNKSSAPDQLRTIDAMLDFRVGLNIVQLMQLRDAQILDKTILRPVLTALAEYFSQSVRKPAQKQKAVLTQLDAMLDGLLITHAFPEKATAVSALIGIRRDLFPLAAAYSSPDKPQESTT